MSREPYERPSDIGSGTAVGWKACRHCGSRVPNRVMGAGDGLTAMRRGSVLRLLSIDFDWQFRIIGGDAFVYCRQQIEGTWSPWEIHETTGAFRDLDEMHERNTGKAREYEVIG